MQTRLNDDQWHAQPTNEQIEAMLSGHHQPEISTEIHDIVTQLRSVYIYTHRGCRAL